MDMKERVRIIYKMSVRKSVKIRLLNELIIDCLNEMEAQEQNMHPEVEHNLAEGYRTAKNCLRKLQPHRMH